MERNIRILYFFNFFTDFRLYASIAIIYFAEVTGSYVLGMSIFSITMISSALLEIPTGIFSDRIGRKKTMVAGALAAFTYSLLYAMGHSYFILAVGAVCEGLSRALYSGNNDALLYDTLAQQGKKDTYSDILGKTGSMFQLALACAGLLGGFLALWSFPLIMWLSVIPQFLCVLLAMMTEEPVVHSSRSGNIYADLKNAFHTFITNRNLRLLSITAIVTYGFGEASYQFQSAFFLTVWPLWAIGLVKAASNLMAAVSFWMSGRVIRRFGRLKILLTDIIYSTVVNLFSLLIRSVVSPIAMISTSLLFGVSTVAKNDLMQEHFSDHQRATMSSLNSFGGSIFFGIVSILLGFTADKLSTSDSLLLLYGFQSVNIVGYWFLFSKTKKIMT